MPKPTLEEKRHRLRALRDQAKLLESLRDNTAERARRQILAKKDEETLTALMKPGELSVRQFDFNRGFLAGAHWYARIPDEAQATLAEAERMANLIDPEKE